MGGAPRRGCRPPAPCLVEESAAGGATETVPTSECRRRPKGTGSRISITAKTSGSARREAREAFTFEARAENDAAGLGGRIFDPDTLPSYRQPRARGPGTSRVPEPAPLRVRSRRGLRVRSELVRFFVVRRCFESSHTVVARSRHPSARQTRCEQLLQARSRGSSVRLVASRGRRDRRCVRSTSALRNRPNSSTRASPFPGAAAIWRCLSAIVRRRALVPEPRGSVLVHANVSFRAPPRPSEDARDGHQEARARLMRTRPGRIALHGATPTLATGRFSRGGVFFRRVKSKNRSPLAPLSPPPRRLHETGFSVPCEGSKAAKTGSAGAS